MGPNHRVEGVCPVLETPFTERGAVDLASFERLIDHLLAVGIRTFMFPGFASEFAKLADAERDELTVVLLERVHRVEDTTVVLSVPDQATVLAVARAERAVELGADMINILPPSLNSPGAAAVQAHVTAVLAAVAPTSAILQYAPALTGTALTASTIAAIAQDAPNLIQVKVESVPPGQLIAELTTNTGLSSVVGYAGVQLPDALRRGAVGVQPGSSFVELYLRMWDLWAAGRIAEALELHGRMLPYISYWMQGIELIIAAEKRISMLRGLISTDHCRAPARTLDDEELAMIDRFLDEFVELRPVPDETV